MCRHSLHPSVERIIIDQGIRSSNVSAGKSTLKRSRPSPNRHAGSAGNKGRDDDLEMRGGDGESDMRRGRIKYEGICDDQISRMAVSPCFNRITEQLTDRILNSFILDSRMRSSEHLQTSRFAKICH